MSTFISGGCPDHTTREEWVKQFWKLITEDVGASRLVFVYGDKLQSLLDRLPITELAEVVKEMKEGLPEPEPEDEGLTCRLS